MLIEIMLVLGRIVVGKELDERKLVESWIFKLFASRHFNSLKL